MSFTGFLAAVHDVLDTTLFGLGGRPVTVATVITVLIIVVVTLVASRLVRRGIARAIAQRVGHEGTMSAINGLVHYLVLVVGLSIGLQTLGIDLTALFAAGAVFAVGIGFAMKNIAENFVSGVILLGERSIRPGDVLAVEGRTVKVMRMGIRATIVQTRDGEEIIMPNTLLVQNPVTNYTLAEQAIRTRVAVGVVYGSDMRVVAEALNEAARAVAREVPEIADDRDPEVLMVQFGDNAVEFELAVWTTDPWRVRLMRSHVAQRVWWTLKERGVTIAFPQLDLHLDPPVAESLRLLSDRA